MDDDRPATGFDPPIGDQLAGDEPDATDEDVEYVTEWNWPFILGALAIVVALGALVAFLTLRDDDAPPPTTTTTTTAAPPTTQVSAASTIGQLLPLDTQFAGVVELAAGTDVIEQLDSEDEVTLFAPTSDAVSGAGALPEAGSDAARDLLRRHMVEGSLDQEDLRQLDGSSVTTLAGDELPVVVAEDGSISVGGATITKSAIVASNGVIFVVDSLVAT
jgi:uncharacterized surface protein with fasciclin (FAS1) repeats